MELWWVDVCEDFPKYPESIIPAWCCDECMEFLPIHFIRNGVYDFLLYEDSIDFEQAKQDLLLKDYKELLAEYQRMERRFHNRHWEIIPILP